MRLIDQAKAAEYCMTQLSQASSKRPRRLVSESTLSLEEIAQRQAIREEFAARCRPIFDKALSGINQRPLQLVYCVRFACLRQQSR